MARKQQLLIGAVVALAVAALALGVLLVVQRRAMGARKTGTRMAVFHDISVPLFKDIAAAGVNLESVIALKGTSAFAVLEEDAKTVEGVLAKGKTQSQVESISSTPAVVFSLPARPGAMAAFMEGVEKAKKAHNLILQGLFPTERYGEWVALFNKASEIDAFVSVVQGMDA